MPKKSARVGRCRQHSVVMIYTKSNTSAGRAIFIIIVYNHQLASPCLFLCVRLYEFRLALLYISELAVIAIWQ
jgi:hypothetical protein